MQQFKEIKQNLNSNPVIFFPNWHLSNNCLYKIAKKICDNIFNNNLSFMKIQIILY